MKMNYLDSKQRVKTGYSTPDRKSLQNSNISTGYQDRSSESCNFNNFNIISLNKTEDFLKYDHLTFRNINSLKKKEEKMKKRKLLKQVLCKMVFCKYDKNKASFERIRQLPERIRNIQQKDMKNNRLLQKISEKIIFKAPITAQTSLIRLILNFRNSNKKKDQENEVHSENRKSPILVKNTLYSTTIYPTQENNYRKMQIKAIIILQHFSKMKIKTAIRCFRKRAQNCNVVKGYFFRVIGNFQQNRRYFIRKLRAITNIERENILNVKRKCLEMALNKCIQRRDKILVENLKAVHFGSLINKLVFLELIRKKSENIMLRAFFAIYKQSSKKLMRNPEDLSQCSQGSKKFKRTNNIQSPHLKNLRIKIESLRKRKNEFP